MAPPGRQLQLAGWGEEGAVAETKGKEVPVQPCSLPPIEKFLCAPAGAAAEPSTGPVGRSVGSATRSARVATAGKHDYVAGPLAMLVAVRAKTEKFPRTARMQAHGRLAGNVRAG